MIHKIQLISIVIVFMLVSTISTEAQTIKAEKGYSTQIGNMVSMLEDLKSRITRRIANLNQEETDFLLDEDANRIGALIYHLAATEKYYQLYTFENRGFKKDEEKWSTALSLGENARGKLKDKPIDYYLDIWDEVRKETLRLLKTKDDKWFEANVKGSSMNNHWAWYHVMEHQANHMGQIALISSRF
ncbi:DinB family protein [Aureibaculum sp. 2210JD6-5]|uniref:DinB family protein n=1 Tax=Aureibaculum sp. 2210JD6-5 TaxID=3103957 RepID=UPI002AAEEE42|nr:DinB family protein [Aureibaculum sp. 2210JD6-5]MDY7394548.1 DinB family protein [Aureibaculum sp. 2210JD6-5]